MITVRVKVEGRTALTKSALPWVLRQLRGGLRSSWTPATTQDKQYTEQLLQGVWAQVQVHPAIWAELSAHLLTAQSDIALPTNCLDPYWQEACGYTVTVVETDAEL